MFVLSVIKIKIFLYAPQSWLICCLSTSIPLTSVCKWQISAYCVLCTNLCTHRWTQNYSAVARRIFLWSILGVVLKPDSYCFLLQCFMMSCDPVLVLDQVKTHMSTGELATVPSLVSSLPFPHFHKIFFKLDRDFRCLTPLNVPMCRYQARCSQTCARKGSMTHWSRLSISRTSNNIWSWKATLIK